MKKVCRKSYKMLSNGLGRVFYEVSIEKRAVEIVSSPLNQNLTC